MRRRVMAVVRIRGSARSGGSRKHAVSVSGAQIGTALTNQGVLLAGRPACRCKCA